MKLVTALLTAVFVLAGCASSGMNSKEREALYQDYVTQHKLESLNKITAFKFYGWRSLDDSHLILKTSASRSYLITLKSSCIELRFAHGIIVNNSMGSTLNSGFDSISVAKTPQQKCFIDEIYQLTSEQADEIVNLSQQKSSAP